jgi:hypothetical protein
MIVRNDVYNWNLIHQSGQELEVEIDGFPHLQTRGGV